MRLDEPLWSETPAGTIGAPDLLATLLFGKAVSYRPLLTIHSTRNHPATPPPERVKLFPTLAALAEEEWYHEFVASDLDRERSNDTDFLGACLYDHEGGRAAYMAFQLDWRDRRVAILRLLALGASHKRDRRRLAATWRDVYRVLVDRGALAVIANETRLAETCITHLHTVAGFQTARAVLSLRGLSEAEATIEVAQWNAEIQGDRVESFSVVGGWPPAAHHGAVADAVRLLVLRLTIDLAHYGYGDPPDHANAKLLLSGTIDLSGSHTWKASFGDSDGVQGDTADAHIHFALKVFRDWLLRVHPTV